MTNLNLIRRFYCTPIGNYYFLSKKNRIDNRKNKTNIAKNKKKILISNNNSYKFLYSFNKCNSKKLL